MDRNIETFYTERSTERNRLREGEGWLEFERTRELIGRYLPDRPQRILDVGGAAGIYAEWLAGCGARCAPDRPDAAAHRAGAGSGRVDWNSHSPSSLAMRGRCRRPDESADIVLLLGPLYHLNERADRVQALSEALRVLKPNGRCFAVAISRFASLFSGLAWGLLDDPEFREIVERDLRDGQHRNPTGHPDWFTTAYFHHPDEIEAEAREAGLAVEGLYGVEGMPGWIIAVNDLWKDPARRDLLLDAARATESDTSLRGLSSHMLLVSRKPVS